MPEEPGLEDGDWLEVVPASIEPDCEVLVIIVEVPDKLMDGKPVVWLDCVPTPLLEDEDVAEVTELTVSRLVRAGEFSDI